MINYKLVKNIKDLNLRKQELKVKYLKNIIAPRLFKDYFEMRILQTSDYINIFPEKNSEHSYHHREKLHQTYNENISVNFFETWKHFDKDRYFLISTNFNFKRLVNDNYENFLCLHSEPNDNDKSNNIFKISPHLHLEFAGEPFRHSHIGLFTYEINSIIKSFQSYDKAIQLAIKLINTEIIQKL